MIFTQEREDEESSTGLYAVLGYEEELYMETRRQHIQNREKHRPVWIYGPGITLFTDEEVEALIAQYRKLSLVLRTQNPEDMIRALYPILWGRPVESQRELLTLVSTISQRSSLTDKVDSGPQSVHADVQRLRSLSSADTEYITDLSMSCSRSPSSLPGSSLSSPGSSPGSMSWASAVSPFSTPT